MNASILLWFLLQNYFTTAEVSIEECRQKGFDPLHLACSTCDKLISVDPKLKEPCYACCQFFLDVTNRLQPYVSAVLVRVQSPYGRGSVVDELLQDENWESFVQKELGGRLQVLTIDDVPRSRSMMYQLQQLQQRLSGEVFFLETELPKQLSHETVQKLAKERISLRDLNKDDVKDMLQTLITPPSSGPSWSFF